LGVVVGLTLIFPQWLAVLVVVAETPVLALLGFLGKDLLAVMLLAVAVGLVRPVAQTRLKLAGTALRRL
jgi:hypothetical protein